MGVTVNKSGTVLWKNGIPADNVEVRIFDQDVGGNDDDATLNPGRSNGQGRFTIGYDIERGIDTISSSVPYWVWVGGQFGHWERRNKTVTVPDPRDAWTAYLLFKYQVQGQNLQHWAWPENWTQSYTLPHVGRAERQTWAVIDHHAASGTTTVVVQHQTTGTGTTVHQLLRWTINRSGDSWSPFTDIPGSFGEGPLALARDQQQTLTMFARNASGQLVWRQQLGFGGPWADWQNLGGNFPAQGAVAAGNAQDGTLELFIEGPGGAVWHTRQQGAGFASPQPFGGTLAAGGALCLARNQDGRLELFANGTDGAIWHNYQAMPNGAWSGWASMGGAMVPGPLAVAANADGRLEVFALAQDGSAQHSWQPAPNNGPWAGWANLGGTWRGQFVALRDADGRLNLFAQSAEREMQVRRQGNVNWGGWRSLGALIPALVSDAPAPATNAGLLADGRPFMIQAVAVSGEPPQWFRARRPGSNDWDNWHALGVATAATAPPKPTNVSVAALDGALRVSWAASPGASGYAVRFGLSPSRQPFTQDAGSATQVDLNPLSNGLAYHVSVSASSAGGSSDATAPIAGTPQGSASGVFDLNLLGYQIDTAPFPPGPVFNRYFNVGLNLRNNGTRPTGPFVLEMVHERPGGVLEVDGVSLVYSMAPGQVQTVVFGLTVSHGAPLPVSELHTWLPRIGPNWHVGEVNITISNH